MSKKQECLNCGGPAVACTKTVPLCAACKALAEPKARGVSYQGKQQGKQQPKQA